MREARHNQGAIVIEEKALPEPGVDQARVRITTAGVCHSDLHIVRGDWSGMAQEGPIGHEAIGVVDALGPGAEAFVSVGDRVILGLGGMGGGYWCGACDSCLRGAPQQCAHSQGIMGTFAEYGGVAASLVFSAKMAGFHLGLDVLRRSGLFVAVALPPESEGMFSLHPFQIFMRDPIITYSSVGHVGDMRDVVDLVARGKVRTHVGRRGPMEDLGAIFDDLEATRYLGRAVVDIG